MNQKQFQKKVARGILLFLLALFIPLSPAFATGVESYGVADTVNRITGEVAPDVSVAELESRIEEKGMDVVHILQKVGLPVCSVLFILFCIHFVMGIFGNARAIWQSILGMGSVGLAYTGILEGEAIVKWIASWIVS